MIESNNDIIESIKSTHWNGKSEIEFEKDINAIFRTEEGLREQIHKIPKTEYGVGLIYVAISDEDAPDGVRIITQTAYFEEESL